MGFEIPDLDKVEAQQFGGLPAKGWHNAEVMEVKTGKSKNENPMLEITFDLGVGSARHWLTITPKSLPNVKAKLLILGVTLPSGGGSIEPQSLIGRKCQVYVEHRPYFDTKTNEQKTGIDINVWAKPNTHPVTAGVDPVPATAPEGWGTTGVDDDIPF